MESLVAMGSLVAPAADWSRKSLFFFRRLGEKIKPMSRQSLISIDRVVVGGRVVTPEGARRADVGIGGERIVAIGRDVAALAPEASRIDARGHFVLPGAIDAHTHFALPAGEPAPADDFATGTRAAARGGVTTIVDFATPALSGGRHQSLARAVDEWMTRAAPRAMVDYAFHGVITDWAWQREEIASLIARGLPTFNST